MSCLFCKIIEGVIPATKEYEDEHTLVFHDIHPQAPIHLLVIPKKHIPSFNDIDAETLVHIKHTIKEVTKKMGLDEQGYRIINNCGESAGQTVFHVHFHIIGGKKLSWGNFVDDMNKCL